MELEEQLLLITLFVYYYFEAGYLLRFYPSFDDSLHNLSKRYGDDLKLILISGQSFTLNLEVEIQILNCIYFEVYQQKKKQKNEIEDAEVFNNQASKSKINTLSGYMNHEGKDTKYITLTRMLHIVPIFFGSVE